MSDKKYDKSLLTGKKNVTSRDVAKVAGVSQSTVSRALNPNSILSDKTRENVLSVMKELNYKPNAIARSLTAQKTNIIGIVMVRSVPFYNDVLSEFTRRLQNMNKQILLFSCEEDQDIDDILSNVLQYRVDGLIIASASLSSKMADECEQSGTPVILFNRYVPNSCASAVCCDNVEGGRIAANFLLDGGHKRLAYISGTENASTNKDRKKGFIDRLSERGINHVIVERGTFTYDSGAEATRRLLKSADRPDAIFCADDTMALGAMDVARHEFGLKIPEDLSIIGFDDIQMASWQSYNLTTVRQPMARMCNTTIELLLAHMNNEYQQSILRLLDVNLIQRGSARLPENKY